MPIFNGRSRHQPLSCCCTAAAKWRQKHRCTGFWIFFCFLVLFLFPLSLSFHPLLLLLPFPPYPVQPHPIAATVWSWMRGLDWSFWVECSGVCLFVCCFFFWFFCNRDVRSNPLSALSLGTHAVSVSDHSLAAGACVGKLPPPPF